MKCLDFDRKVFKAVKFTEEENDIIKKLMKLKMKRFSQLVRHLIFNAIPKEDRCESMKTDL